MRYKHLSPKGKRMIPGRPKPVDHYSCDMPCRQAVDVPIGNLQPSCCERFDVPPDPFLHARVIKPNGYFSADEYRIENGGVRFRNM
jgi:hypothetical protein